MKEACTLVLSRGFYTQRLRVDSILCSSVAIIQITCSQSIPIIFKLNTIYAVHAPNKSSRHEEALSVAGFDPLIYNAPEVDERRRIEGGYCFAAG